MSGATGTALARALKAGEFVVSAELTPPTGPDLAPTLADATRLVDLGVAYLNVSDSPRGRARMSSIATAHLVRKHAGADVIANVTGRDRNLTALRAELLGAHALGVRNVLALTGDEPATATHATSVRDVDSIGLLGLIRELDGASLCAGAAFGPAAPDQARELDRLRRKVEHGATFVMTQPVFEASDLEPLLAQATALGVPVIVGVIPAVDHELAALLEHVPGIDVPDHAVGAGPALAQSLVATLQGRVAGIHLMPFGRPDATAEVIAALR